MLSWLYYVAVRMLLEFYCPLTTVQVCSTPAALLRDISGLKYISRGASCIVFQGAQCRYKLLCLRQQAATTAASANL
jgi:hypothetical protein